jgi:hypothetical protein
MVARAVDIVAVSILGACNFFGNVISVGQGNNVRRGGAHVTYFVVWTVCTLYVMKILSDYDYDPGEVDLNRFLISALQVVVLTSTVVHLTKEDVLDTILHIVTASISQYLLYRGWGGEWYMIAGACVLTFMYFGHLTYELEQERVVHRHFTALLCFWVGAYVSLYYVSVIMGPVYNEIISRETFSVVNAVADVLLALAVYPNLVCYSWALIRRERLDLRVDQHRTIQNLKAVLHASPSERRV